MKIAFTTTGDTLDAELDPRFGRANRFLIYDSDQKNLVIIDNNQNLNAAQGAGIQAATTLCKTGATVLITGHCGPKAFKVLTAAGVKIYPCKAKTLTEALAQFNNHELSETREATNEGHWI
ncbi:MAG: dinitrogenase iron-molybdenum cofactor biosynthesis protein [Desulfobacteraceae bacterium 4572_35.2]|nr:MAG: dinitrogenase iron-molybdenum cofactor biosynthesis protein [Desulfobacteraceae bacterium 4572_35.2]